MEKVIYEQINNDIKEAMKAKEKEKLDALRYLKAMLMENNTSKSPVAEMDVVIRHHKKLKDSLDLYPAGSEQRTKIDTEAGFVSAYLPKQLSEAEVVAFIKEIAAAQENPNLGTIMKELNPKVKGKFDGKAVSELVKSYLNS